MPEADVPRAGLAVAALLLALALPASSRRDDAVCADPRERVAHADHSVVVECGAGAHRDGSLRGPARLLFGQPIDPNRADAATLDVLPGIGPSRAAALIESREQRPFSGVEDLLRVPGIGPRRLALIRPYLGVGESPGVGALEGPRRHLHSPKGR